VTQGFRIRRATPRDYAELAGVFRISVQEVASRDYSPAQIAAWVSVTPDWDSPPSQSVVFMAEDNDRPIGFIEYEPPDNVGMTYVHPRHLRKGVGRALLGALETEACNRVVPMLNVEASITSRLFFEACGYTMLTPQIVHVRGQDFLNYRMMKRLIPSQSSE